MNVWNPPDREPSPLQASVRVPGSKSLTNRALLAAALATGTTTLEHALFSDDSQYFLGALRALGFEVEAEAATARICVSGLGGRIPATEAELFIGNAGTAARFLTAMLAVGHGTYVLDGEPRMRERPIGDLVLALRELGADVTQLAANPPADPRAWCPPLRVNAAGLSGGITRVAGT
jgi:3-phosphoshikimate 1-carboxyvinyltransferase